MAGYIPAISFFATGWRICEVRSVGWAGDSLSLPAGSWGDVGPEHRVLDPCPEMALYKSMTVLGGINSGEDGAFPKVTRRCSQVNSRSGVLGTVTYEITRWLPSFAMQK